MFTLFDMPPMELNGGIIIIQDTAGCRLAVCTSLVTLPIAVKQKARVLAINRVGSDVVITVTDWSTI